MVLQFIEQDKTNLTILFTSNTGDIKLVFEVKGEDWYISKTSLRNDNKIHHFHQMSLHLYKIFRETVSETFDFRFEFYDINNNYILLI